MELLLVYPPPHYLVFAAVNAHQYFYPVSTRSDFSQARIGAEFGSTPWARASFRAPRKAVAVATFGRSAPPPYWAEIVATKGSGGGIASWWAHHSVRMTGGSSGKRLQAEPGATATSSPSPWSRDRGCPAIFAGAIGWLVGI
ncbi:MAG TPA: hypothetical protein VHY31_17315 [Streptosporangiaceae bacterium]|nr:hypothetical protein [Streptosporangiaceae bacterium]